MIVTDADMQLHLAGGDYWEQSAGAYLTEHPHNVVLADTPAEG